MVFVPFSRKRSCVVEQEITEVPCAISADFSMILAKERKKNRIHTRPRENNTCASEWACASVHVRSVECIVHHSLPATRLVALLVFEKMGKEHFTSKFEESQVSVT